MVNSPFLCATLKRHRKDHTPFVQAEAETSDTGAEAVKLESQCSWQVQSRSVGADVGDENLESHSVLYPLHIQSVICIKCCTSVFIVRWTDELVCARCKWVSWFKMSVHSHQVNTEVSRYPGSQAQHARGSASPLRWSSSGWMLTRIGRLSDGIGRKHPVIFCKALLITGSVKRVWVPGRCAVLRCWMDQG